MNKFPYSDSLQVFIHCLILGLPYFVKFTYPITCLFWDNFTSTVCMKYLTIISGQLHLLHQLKGDFAHLLALLNLVIELINAKK